MIMIINTLSDADDKILTSSGMNELSPIGYDANQQAEVHDELKEFLGSDDESESDLDGDGDNDMSAGSESKKRKRKQEGGEDTDNASRDEAEGTESRLAQRVKLSRGRTSHLKEVTSVVTPGEDPDGGEELEGAEGDGDDGDDGYPEDPDDDDDELEREMLAAFEDGDYDEEADGEMAAENG
jgi:RNA polymerase II subunit A-like phosphatase